MLNALGDRRPVKDDGIGTLLNLRYSVRNSAASRNIALGSQALLLDNKDKSLKPVRNVMYASNAFDGDKSTRAQAGGQFAWTLGTDLGKLFSTISRCKVYFAKDSYATEFVILASEDGKSWQQVAKKSDNKSLEVEISFAPKKARYLKLRSIKPDGPNQEGGQMSVAEFEVFQGK